MAKQSFETPHDDRTMVETPESDVRQTQDVQTEVPSQQAYDPWTRYTTAQSAYDTGAFQEAYNAVNAALAQFLKQGQKPPSQLYKLKYELLITTGQHVLAYNGIEHAVELYPDYVDLYFYKGILHFVREDYKRAERAFSYCMILGEGHPEYKITPGCGSYLALCFIGLCHAKRGDYKLAAEAFRQGEALCPGPELTKKILGYLKTIPSNSPKIYEETTDNSDCN